MKKYGDLDAFLFVKITLRQKRRRREGIIDLGKLALVIISVVKTHTHTHTHTHKKRNLHPRNRV
jgi:hypothetical protein